MLPLRLKVLQSAATTVAWRHVMRRTLSAHAEPQSTATVQEDLEYKNAKPFAQIPGPSLWELIRDFAPGGKFHGLTTTDLHMLIRDTYGSVVRFKSILGKADMVITFKPDHFEKVFRTEGVWPVRRGIDTFAYYRKKVRPEVFKDMGGLVSDQGETWLKMRSAVNPVMLQPKIVKSYVEPVDLVARDFIKKIRLMRDANDEMPDDFGNELNAWALESIGVIALDQRLGVLSFDKNPETEQIIKAVKDFFQIAYELEVEPSIWRYYKTAKFKRLMSAFDVMTNLAMKYVDDAVIRLEKAEKDGSFNENDTNSVLYKLLKINKDYAVLMCFDMLFAGIDTTSSATASLLYVLAKNPDKQDELRKEIMKMLPNVDSPLTTESLNNLPYLRACIKESMRIQPVVGGNLRAAGRDIVLDGYQIPRDTDVAMGSTVLSHDSTYFPDHKQFIPERWLRNNSSQHAFSKAISPFVYLPFGFGPRTCIGKRFAELEIQILAARILREFKVDWNYGPIEYATALVISPSSKLKYKLTKI